jgi:hypothetical protein
MPERVEVVVSEWRIGDGVLVRLFRTHFLLKTGPDALGLR